MERSSSSEERIQACLREFRRRKIEKQKEKAKVSYLTASLNFEVIHVGAGETMRAVEEMLATKDKAMMDRVALRGFSESTENRNIPIDNTSGVNKLGSLHISQSRPHLPWTKRIEGFPNKNENTPTDDTSESTVDRIALRERIEGFSESTENRNIPIDNTSGFNKLGSLHVSQSRPHLPWTKHIEGFSNTTENENTPTDDTSELYKVGSLQISEEPPYEEIQRSRVPPSDDSVYYWI